MPYGDNEKVAAALQVLRPFAIAYARVIYYGHEANAPTDIAIYAEDTEEVFHQLHAQATEFGAGNDELLNLEHLRLAAETYRILNNGVPAHQE